MWHQSLQTSLLQLNIMLYICLSYGSGTAASSITIRNGSLLTEHFLRDFVTISFVATDIFGKKSGTPTSQRHYGNGKCTRCFTICSLEENFFPLQSCLYDL